MKIHRHKYLSVLILWSLLFSIFPTAIASAQTNEINTSPQTEAPEVITVPNTPKLQLPSLSFHIDVAQDTVFVGDTVPFTITLYNASEYPAHEVVVTLERPDGSDANDTGLKWIIPSIESYASASVSDSVRVIDIPRGNALLLRAEVVARGLTMPIVGHGGSLVLASQDDTSQARLRVQEQAKLQSKDERVSVAFPERAFGEELTLEFAPRPTKEALDASTQGQYRAYGAFALNATTTSAQAKDVHQFAKSYTLEINYSPELLLAWGIDEVDLTALWFNEDTQQWAPIASEIDSEHQLVRAQLDHFSNFALGEDLSASAAFIPSLQGFQTSDFTGAATFSYPIEVPSGAAGHKPSIVLSYSSASSDGIAGQRLKNQASWVGGDWNLDFGSVSINKLPNGEYTYSLSVNGASYDISPLTSTVGGTPTTRVPTNWTWEVNDSSFVKIEAQTNGLSTSTIGGTKSLIPQPRYRWVMWAKDGTRYTFEEDAWWGWTNCDFETRTWYLSSIVDTHGNTITYEYDRLQTPTTGTCGIAGNIDVDVWPISITWAGGRLKAEFTSSPRTMDTQSIAAPNQLKGTNGQPRQTRQLDTIEIKSKQASSWELISLYRLNYYASSETDKLLYSDKLEGTGCPSGHDKCPNKDYPRLTLKSIQRIGNNAYSPSPSALPATTFTYGGFHIASPWKYVSGATNRLVEVNNGQGGVTTIAYENIGAVVATTHNDYEGKSFDNYRRVTSYTQSNGLGKSYISYYMYGEPLLNWLGTAAGALVDNDWATGHFGTTTYPTSAALYFNAFQDPTRPDNNQWLAHRQNTEFRGHSWVRAYDPIEKTSLMPDKVTDISLVSPYPSTNTYFHQGVPLVTSPCIITATGVNIAGDPTAPTPIPPDSCFAQYRDSEMLKGKSYRVDRFQANGVLLQMTLSSYGVYWPVPSNYWTTQAELRLTGNWKSYVLPTQTEQRSYEGSSSYISKTTKTFYNSTCNNDDAVTIKTNYGNIGCVEEYTGSTLFRQTKTNYAAPNITTGYIVDRPSQTAVYDENGYVISITNMFYDNDTNTGAAPTVGNLRRVSKVVNIPANIIETTGLTLRTQDTTYTYDIYGNQTSVSTYQDFGTRSVSGSTTIFSTPGNGSATSTTTTSYDTIYRAFPVQITNPLGHIQRAGYDFRMGTLTRVTGPNTTGTPTNCNASSFSIPATEETTCAQYDVFGRAVKIIKPGDSTTYPTTQMFYYDTQFPFRYQVRHLEEHGSSSAARSEQFFYDGLGRQIQTKNESTGSWRNIISMTEYDGLGRVIAEGQPRYILENGTTTYQYTNVDSSFFQTTTTTYDGLNRPIRITQPDGSFVEHKYGVVGSYLFDDVIDAERHRTQYRSDVFGRLREVIEVGGNCGTAAFSWATCAAPYTEPFTTGTANAVTTYTYDALDQLIKTTDAAGNQTSMTYNSAGQKTAMRDPDMGNWYYAYNANGQIVGQVDARGWPTSYSYDPLGRLVALTSYDYNSVYESFDTKDTSAWVWNSHQTVPHLDGCCNVVKNEGTNANWSASYYRSSSSINHGKGVILRFKVSSTNPQAIFALESSSGTDYRRFSVMIIDGKAVVQVTLDGSTYPTVATLLPTVQANSWYELQLTANDIAGFTAYIHQESNPNNQGSYTMPMDTGRNWRFRHYLYRDISYVDNYREAISTRYIYDQGTNGKGRLTTGLTTFVNESMSYDARGRQTAKTHTINGVSGSRTFNWTYDAADRIKTISYPAAGSTAAQTLTYGYDEGWRPTSLHTTLGDKTLVSGATYTALDQPDVWSFGNGASQDWDYNSTNALLNRIRVLNSGSSAIFNRNYAYDKVANVKTITDNLSSSNNQTYTYDHRDRLTSWTLGSTTQTYTYNAIGNLLSKTGVGNYTYPASGSNSVRPHTPSAVNGGSYAYDENGNLTSGGGRTYTWRANNSLGSVSHVSGSESFAYNADGQRVRKTVGSTNTIYLEGGLLEEIVGGSAKFYYPFNGQTVAMYDTATSAFSYLHGDHLGSAGLATNAAGGLAQSQEFDAWGKVRSGGISLTDINYTGQRLDISGLLNYNARMYDPNLGRFISADSVVPGTASGSMDGIALKPLTVAFVEYGFINQVNQENQFPAWFQMSDQQKQQAGWQFGPLNPQSLNRYSYVLNNPMKYTDPSGHSLYLDPTEAAGYASTLRRVANAIDILSSAIISNPSKVMSVVTEIVAAAAASGAISGAMAALMTTGIGMLIAAGIAVDAHLIAKRLHEFADIIDEVRSVGQGVIISADCGGLRLTCDIYIINAVSGHGKYMEGSNLIFGALLGDDIYKPGTVFDTSGKVVPIKLIDGL
jgi:RHS repeat-associated protein